MNIQDGCLKTLIEEYSNQQNFLKFHLILIKLCIILSWRHVHKFKMHFTSTLPFPSNLRTISKRKKCVTLGDLYHGIKHLKYSMITLIQILEDTVNKFVFTSYSFFVIFLRNCDFQKKDGLIKSSIFIYFTFCIGQFYNQQNSS